MQNMSSVANQMPSGSPHPLLGNGVQKENVQLSVHDIDGTSAGSPPPDAFHNVLQSTLRVRDQAEEYAAPQGVTRGHGETQGRPRIEGQQGVVSEKTPEEEQRSCCRDSGEQVVVAEEQYVLHGHGEKVRMRGGKGARRSDDGRDDDGRVHDREQGHEGETNGRTDGVCVVSSATTALQSIAAETGERVFSPAPGHGVFEKTHGHLQSAHRHTGEHSTVHKTTDRLHGEPVQGGTEGRGDAGLSVNAPGPEGSIDRLESRHKREAGPSVDVPGPEGSIERLESRHKRDAGPSVDVPGPEGSIDRLESRHKREANGKGDGFAALPSPKDGSGGSMLQAETGKKVSQLPGDAAAPADAAPRSIGSADGERTLSPVHDQGTSEKAYHHVRVGPRQRVDQPVPAEERSGARGTAVVAEMDGSGGAERSVDIRDMTGRSRTLEAGEREHEGYASRLSVLASAKESHVERVRSAGAVEKTPTLPSDLVFQAADGVAASASSADAEGVHAPGRQPEFLGQVVETTRTLMQQGGGRVLISLNPPSLGALDLDVRVNKEGIELYMVANSSDVQRTLCSHVEQLRSALGELGLNMDRFQVVVGDRSDGQTARDSRQEGMTHGQWEARSEQGSLPRADGDTRDDEVRKATLSGPSSSAGMINVFI